MKEVEPSKVEMIGECYIQTEVCTAKISGPITAVWTPPGRTQTNVCHACFDEMIRRGEWKVKSAKLSGSVKSN